MDGVDDCLYRSTFWRVCIAVIFELCFPFFFMCCFCATFPEARVVKGGKHRGITYLYMNVFVVSAAKASGAGSITFFTLESHSFRLLHLLHLLVRHCTLIPLLRRRTDDEKRPK